MDNKKPFSLDEVHFRLILLDLLKNAWVALLAVIVACIAVFSYGTSVYKPRYTCDATFSVSTKSSGAFVSFYSSMNTAAEMAEVFREVFSSDVLKRMIREDLENQNLNFTISSKVAEGTNILTVSATADTPWQAQQVMRSLMKNYGQVSDYLFGSVVLDVLKYPRVPTAPSNPFPARSNMIKFGSLAAMGTMALIVLLSVLRPTVKTVRGAKLRLGEGPLGVLPMEKRIRSRRFGKREKKAPLITDANIGFHYTESLLQTMHGIRHKMEKRGHKSILVTSVAENEGKSTISANLALALARHGHRVALVDLDLRRPSIKKVMGAFPRYSLAECIKKGVREFPTDQSNLLIFSAESAAPHSGKVLHNAALKGFIAHLRETMDYVVIDSAPYTAAADTGMLLSLVDCCVMVIRHDWTPHGLCKSVAEDLDRDRAEYLGYVVNCYQDKTVLLGAKDHYGNYSYYGRYAKEETR